MTRNDHPCDEIDTTQQIVPLSRFLSSHDIAELNKIKKTLDLECVSTGDLIDLLKKNSKIMRKFFRYYKKMDYNSKEYAICNDMTVMALRLLFMIEIVVGSRLDKELNELLLREKLKKTK